MDMAMRISQDNNYKAYLQHSQHLFQHPVQYLDLDLYAVRILPTPKP